MTLLDSPPHVVQLYPRIPLADADGNSGWVEDPGSPVAFACWVTQASSTPVLLNGTASLNAFMAIGREIQDSRVSDARALEGARATWEGRTFKVDGRVLPRLVGRYVRHVTLRLIEVTG